MKTRINTLLRKSSRSMLHLTLLSGVAAAPLLAGGGAAATDPDQQQASHEHGGTAPAKLVQIVRDATRQFIDVNLAGAS